MPLRTVKPQTLGLMSKAYTQGDQHSLVIATLGIFELGGANKKFLNDFQALPKVFPELPGGEPLDALYPKARGEVLLAAQAHAKDQQPVTKMSVRLQLGSIDKQLHVSGDRSVTNGLLATKISDPVPFKQMPLDWAHAYGGEQHSCNKSGIGYTGKDKTQALPNIEYPGQAISHGNQNRTPAGFAPRSTLCPDRQALFGTYDKEWLKKYAPNLPLDFKPAAFNAAPTDQQIKGWFAGGETYCLQGMHADKPEIKGKLPEFRVRVLLQRERQTTQQAEIHETQLDTVWLIPHIELGVCIYRCEVDCMDSDAEDITALLAAYEHKNSIPRTADHYRKALEQRTNIKTRQHYVFNDVPLVPEQDPEQLKKIRAQHAQLEATDLKKRQDLLDEMDVEFWANNDMQPPEDYTPPRAEPLPLGLVTPEAIMNGAVDMAEVMAKADALISDTEKKGKEKLDDLKKSMQKGKLARLQAKNKNPEADPEKDKRDAEQRASLKPASPLAEVAQLTKDNDDLSDKQKKQITDAESTLAEQQSKARSMAINPVHDPVSDEVAAHLRQLVRGWLRAGIPLAGRDLSGADLHGMDFSAQDLSGCLLESTNLTDARFTYAVLKQTVFTGATLNQTDFAKADLSEANLNKVTGEACNFSGATMDKASLVESKLPGANLGSVKAKELISTTTDFTAAHFEDAAFEQCMFIGLIAPQSAWSRATINHCVLTQAQLSAADFSHSTLTKVILCGIKATGSRWDRARMTKVLLNLAELKRASFQKLLASESSWRDSALEESNWHGAQLLKSDLSEARLHHANLRHASFAQCLLIRSVVTHADARNCDFFQALLRKTNFSKTDLRDANLVRAMDAEANYKDARLDGAVRTRLGEAV